MTDANRGLKKPRLIYQTRIERAPYRRRFRFSALLLAVVMLALLALTIAAGRDLVDPLVLDVGAAAGGLAAALLFLRAVVNLVRWRTRADETLRFFNLGFSWQRSTEKYEYSWNRLATVREAANGLYLRQRPVVQWGDITLIMTDGQVFKVQPRHGDLLRIARAIRPHTADVTGTRMSRRLREKEKPVQLHPQLIVWPGGVEVNKKEIPWSELNVKIEGRYLLIETNSGSGAFEPVMKFPIRAVDNVGGFVELAQATIRTHQRERFGT